MVINIPNTSSTIPLSRSQSTAQSGQNTGQSPMGSTDYLNKLSELSNPTTSPLQQSEDNLKLPFRGNNVSVLSNKDAGCSNWGDIEQGELAFTCGGVDLGGVEGFEMPFDGYISRVCIGNDFLGSMVEFRCDDESSPYYGCSIQLSHLDEDACRGLLGEEVGGRIGNYTGTPREFEEGKDLSEYIKPGVAPKYDEDFSARNSVSEPHIHLSVFMDKAAAEEKFGNELKPFINTDWETAAGFDPETEQPTSEGLDGEGVEAGEYNAFVSRDWINLGPRGGTFQGIDKEKADMIYRGDAEKGIPPTYEGVDDIQKQGVNFYNIKPSMLWPELELEST